MNQPLGTLHERILAARRPAGHCRQRHRASSLRLPSRQDVGSLVFIDIGISASRRWRHARRLAARIAKSSRDRPCRGAFRPRPVESEGQHRRDGSLRVRDSSLNDAKTQPLYADESPVLGGHQAELQLSTICAARRMQQNVILRHRVTMEVRKSFDEQGASRRSTRRCWPSRRPGRRLARHGRVGHGVRGGGRAVESPTRGAQNLTRVREAVEYIESHSKKK